MGNPAFFGVDFCAPKIFRGNGLSGYGLNDLRAGDMHASDSFHHKDKITESGRIDGASRARAQDQRNLRNYPRRKGVAVKNGPIMPQAFLNPRPPGVDQADDRGARP